MERTRDGRLTWATDSGVAVSLSENVTTPVYVATLDQWRIAVYGFRWAYWYEEDQCELIDSTSIELLDEQGRTEWRLPQTDHSYELLHAVGRQHAGADRFAETLLGSRETGTDPRRP